MKNFVFSLCGILNARTAQREAREQQLQNARFKMQQEQRRLREIEEKICAALSSAPMDIVNCSFFQQREKYMALLRRQRQAQAVKLSAAETEVNACMARLREADIELKKMEKLREKEHSRWQLDWLREEQKINDEIGASRSFFRPQQN